MLLWDMDYGDQHQQNPTTPVRLIPKIQGPKLCLDIRTITLCSFDYKFISKILSLWLWPTLFLPGRDLSNTVLITCELLYYLKVLEAKKHFFMAVQTGMSKAYDWLKLPFIQIVLDRLGFDAKWTNWIMQCVTTISYSYLVNDSSYMEMSLHNMVSDKTTRPLGISSSCAGKFFWDNADELRTIDSWPSWHWRDIAQDWFIYSLLTILYSSSQLMNRALWHLRISAESMRQPHINSLLSPNCPSHSLKKHHRWPNLAWNKSLVLIKKDV